MPWLNCMDNPPEEQYPYPCLYHGWMYLSRRITFFDYESIEKRIPLTVPWNGTWDDLDDQMRAFVQKYCEQKGYQGTNITPGGDGDIYATVVLEWVEGITTIIPAVFLKAFQEGDS